MGKKLGIDSTKEEVVNVFKVLKESDNSLADAEDIETSALKAYPTPLWFMFNSELELTMVFPQLIIFVEY